MARLATGQPMFPVALGVQAGILEGALGASKGETAIPWSVFVVCEYYVNIWQLVVMLLVKKYSSIPRK